MSFNEIITVLFLLLSGHAVADYALQSDFIANAKNQTTELGKQFWVHVLPAHSLIHGLAVFLATDLIWLGVAETIIHGVTDYFKSAGKINLMQDQLIHFACKALWLAICILVAV